MTPPSFDESNETYEQLVRVFTEQAAKEFQKVVNDFEQQRVICCRYLKRGRSSTFSQAELIDFLGISSPSVLEMAGYSEVQAERVMEVLAEISDADIQKASL